MDRFYFAETIARFVSAEPDAILGALARRHEFATDPEQRDAWTREVEILQGALRGLDGKVFLEFAVPRLGKRIDALVVSGPAVLVLEFKVGSDTFNSDALDQVWDYALDLKNFHETSHEPLIAPILVATESVPESCGPLNPHSDNVLPPIRASSSNLRPTIDAILTAAQGHKIDALRWEGGRYRPTPTIIEAARCLYSRHSVADIARRDADAVNLAKTSGAISRIIDVSRARSRKSICFLTGVPGAGKTLVGLDIATQHFDHEHGLHGVYLSGNGPLVKILHEALARDHVQREARAGKKFRVGDARRRVEAFIQNVHHFRDECLRDPGPPSEHVALFDEAQRAWNLEKTADFMKRKKGRPNFNKSESEFLISCMDRHQDWATIVCLIGGGQEIHTGEGGISEWLGALNRSFPDWDIYLSPHLSDSEYAAAGALEIIKRRRNVFFEESLHLAVSMRSFRAERLSSFVKEVLDLEADAARRTLAHLTRYPIALTRDLSKAKAWVREHARANERYGLLASSQAERLKPHAIDIRAPLNPVHWFLNEKRDVRSSFFLEDAATEFHVQGLELDWACVSWDADFRHTGKGWQHRSFFGDSWKKISKPERQQYLKNAYRVLLTRARQGMVIFVPQGDVHDETRKPEFYDGTFSYLRDLGLPVLA